MPGQPGAEHFCEWCGDRIPDHARRDSTYCSRSHKVAARRARRRKDTSGVTYQTAGIPLGSLQDGGYPEASSWGPGRSEDTRFHVLLAEQERRETLVVPVDLLDRQRRNPGVALPEIRNLELAAVDEEKARAADLRAIQLDGRIEWTPQDRLRGDSGRGMIASKAMAGRASNRLSETPYQSLPAQEYGAVSGWAQVSTPQPVFSNNAIGRRVPARLMNAHVV
jgi:hypothetical protein